MKQNKGATTLLITSLLLVAALIVILGSYKALFFQIKQAKNQVEARKEYWQAEGALECGYTHIVTSNLNYIPANLLSICNSYPISELKASTLDPDILVAKTGYAKVSKKIQFLGGGGSGAIRSTADLISHGSALLAPPDPGKYNQSDYYECLGIVVKRRFIASGITNQGIGGGIPSPAAGFDQSKSCGSNYQTQTSYYSGIWQNPNGVYQRESIKLDIQQKTDLDPFYDFFGTEKSNWQSVRDSKKHGFIPIEMKGGSDVDCVSKFVGKLKENKPYKVWIDGSCQITDTQLTKLKSLQNKNSKMNLFILVNNGVLGINGSGTIKGMLFHLNHDYRPTIEQWNELKNIKPYLNANFSTYIDKLYGNSSSVSPLLATYFQRGSFSLSGGQIFDSDGQMALFDNSLRLAFNADVINSFSFPTTARWLKGSWHDF
ncbi:hypothetical protein ACPV5J_16105 [Vibrio rotiferianus]|uniref:hypothetical protein n=1 Tax=Vibrio rotiferianus TaxID=190895 RepID=UPI00406A175A